MSAYTISIVLIVEGKIDTFVNLQVRAAYKTAC